MSLPRKQSQESKFQNWHEVAVGISTATRGLVDYLKDTSIHLHTRIKVSGPCAGLKKCSNNCSQRYRDLFEWCPTCTEWRKQILRHHRYNSRDDEIHWGRVDSSQWPESVDEMVKVYGPDWWKGTPAYTCDLAVSVHILNNCSSFCVPEVVCRAVRGVRQGYFARGRLQISTQEKDNALKTLIQLLESSEVAKTKSGKHALKLLILFTEVPNTTTR